MFLTPKEYKALYYKIKYNQWTPIVLYANQNNITRLKDWIIIIFLGLH
jgi:hypothetical protein